MILVWKAFLYPMAGAKAKTNMDALAGFSQVERMYVHFPDHRLTYGELMKRNINLETLKIV